jgi:hypothetical protein
MPTWFKVGPLMVEMVGFYWTIGIFGPIAALLFWFSRRESEPIPAMRWLRALVVALAIAPTLIPGYDSPVFDHLIPVSVVLFLCVVGFGNWVILLCGAVSLLLFTWLFAAVGKRLARKRFSNER